MSEKIIIYQVLPRLFGNDNPTKNTYGTFQENGSGKFDSFDAKTLENLKAVGYTHVWYTGIIAHATKTIHTRSGLAVNHPAIVKGMAGSPYAVRDYYDVDADLATKIPNRMQEFEALVKRTHEAGLKVIMDFVPNHVAREYHSLKKPKGVSELGGQDDNTKAFDPQNNFYYLPTETFVPQIDRYAGQKDPYTETPAKATGNDCFNATPGKNDWYETIKLNYGIDPRTGEKHFSPTPNTWEKMIDILLFWTGKGVDGFRCDMAEMVPAEFWHHAIEKVKNKYPHIIFIAEIYNPAVYNTYIFYGKFDYLYDKVGLYDTLRKITQGEIPAVSLTGTWQAVEGMKDRMLSFMENHDEQRIASDFFAKDARKGRAGMIVAATMGCNPLMIYFGQEIGERGMESEGFSGIDGRTTIFDYWQIDSIERMRRDALTTEEKQLKLFYEGLLGLLNKENALREGSFYDLMWVNTDNDEIDGFHHYAYLRKKNNEVILVVVNFGDRGATIGVNIPANVLDELEIDLQKRASKGTELLRDSSEECELSTFVRTYVPPMNGKIIKYTI